MVRYFKLHQYADHFSLFIPFCHIREWIFRGQYMRYMVNGAPPTLAEPDAPVP